MSPRLKPVREQVQSLCDSVTALQPLTSHTACTPHFRQADSPWPATQRTQPLKLSALQPAPVLCQAMARACENCFTAAPHVRDASQIPHHRPSYSGTFTPHHRLHDRHVGTAGAPPAIAATDPPLTRISGCIESAPTSWGSSAQADRSNRAPLRPPAEPGPGPPHGAPRRPCAARAHPPIFLRGDTWKISCSVGRSRSASCSPAPPIRSCFGTRQCCRRQCR